MKLKALLWRRRRYIVFVGDAACAALSYWLSFVVGLARLGRDYVSVFALTLPMVVGCRLLFFWVFKLDRASWRYASIADLENILKAVASSQALIIALLVFTARLIGYPGRIFVIDALPLVFLLGATRFGYRWIGPSVLGLKRQIFAACAQSQVGVKTVPNLHDVIVGKRQISELDDLDTEGLLGRESISTDLEKASSYLRGKRILATVGGGSIGGEICRQVLEFAPECLILLGKGENSLHDMRLRLTPKRSAAKIHCVLAWVSGGVRAAILSFVGVGARLLPGVSIGPEAAWKRPVTGWIRNEEARPSTHLSFAAPYVRA